MIDAALITLAHQLADSSGAVIKPYFRNGAAISDKDDGTAVTLADRGAEQAIRAVLAVERPDDAIWGEEFGQSPGSSGYRWVLDPIDGTVPFIAGRPTFGTIIGLEYNGETILGMVDQPISGERWWGVKGQSAYFSQHGAQQQINTSQVTAIEQALVGATTITRFTDDELQRFLKLCKLSKRVLFGGDAYGYALLAHGYIDLIIETDLKLYDYCGLLPLIREAGGIVTDWQGQALDAVEKSHVIAAATPALHAAATQLLNA